MTILEGLIQYGSISFAIIALIWKRDGMKKYVPVGLFASFYANLWCYLAIYFNLWGYHHHKILPLIRDISVPVNVIVAPIMAMFWVRYCPLRFKEKLLWAFIWTSLLTVVEVLIERRTNILAYHGSYHWYHSYILWFFTWFIWLGFHLWLNDWKREFDSIF